MTGDYLDKPLAYKLRKVARYVRLYGPGRTWAKIQAQRHLVRSETFGGERWVNAACSDPDHPDRFVALIGCGNFAYSGIAHHLRSRAPRFLRATHDVARSRSRSICSAYGGYYACRNVEVLLADEAVRLLFIASNHASHAEYAIAGLKAGKDVHIEKPQAISEEQLQRLVEVQRQCADRIVYLGYNRPKSPHFRRIKEALDRQDGPTIVNWFIAGHQIPPHHWYFAEEEGGRILGNLCHWTDVTLALLGHERSSRCSIVPISHPAADSDFGFGIRFGDGSLAAFTFSAKGHTFEGVREVLRIHKGDALVSMVDFHSTRVEVLHRRRTFRTLFRDHGHRANIVNSFDGTLARNPACGVPPTYNEATGRLILGVKTALESGEEVSLELG